MLARLYDCPPTNGFAESQSLPELARCQEALRDSELRYRQIVETAAEGIWIAGPRGRTVFANQRMAEMLQAAPESLIGRSAFRYIHRDDRGPLLRRHDALRQGFRQTFDIRLRCTDGSTLWTSVSASPMHNDRGEFLGLLGMFTDISKRRLAQEALRETEEFNRRIIESTEDGIIVMDTEGRLLYLSPGAQRLMEVDEVIACLNSCWLDLWDGSERPRVESAFERARTGGIGSFQAQGMTYAGTHKWWEVTLSAVSGAGGEVERVVAVTRDITERKRLEVQLSQAQKLESIGQLAAGMAHEINTPIQYVGDNARFLKDAFADLQRALEGDEKARGEIDFLCAEIPSAIDQLLEGVDRVAGIVRAMKEFSRQGPAEKTPVDLNRNIESTITVSRNEWKYVAELETDLDPKLPPVVCVGGEINQVVLNLIVNAAHAVEDRFGRNGDKGSIRVATRLDGDWVQITVADTGSGIPENIRPHVFNPFFTTKEVGRGSGQGLAIAHSVVVRHHGGSITFETEVGQGTIFIVRLPLGGTG